MLLLGSTRSETKTLKLKTPYLDVAAFVKTEVEEEEGRNPK